MDKSTTQSRPPTGGVIPSPRLLRAVATAARAHEGHYRKSTTIPYISHPFSVMLLASRVTDDEDVLVAALFHDILEDVPEFYSAEQMSAEFGPRVVDIVRGVTKDESIRDWQGRSDAYLAALAKAPEGSVIVAAADKFHNLSSTLEDLRRDGRSVWGRFNSSPGQQLWWYTSVLEVISGRLPGLPLLPELGEMVDQLRAYVEE
nr:HD domain-containing protein [Corynebacterium lactis]